jgi:hypothetical protein
MDRNLYNRNQDSRCVIQILGMPVEGICKINNKYRLRTWWKLELVEKGNLKLKERPGWQR